MYHDFVNRMQSGLKELKVNLSENQMEQFYQYYQWLMERNTVMNLTAITEMDEVIDKHFIDSLSLIKVVKDLPQSKLKIIDVGTGAGFPGIPLKIAFPQLSFTMLDSLNKRIEFLREMIQRLNLKEIQTIHGRAEDYGKNPEYREHYDICVSRAVAHLSSLSEYCIPFVKIEGKFIAYKSDKIEEELARGKKAIYELGGELEKIEKFSLADNEINRTLVIIGKRKKTNKKYPRRAGIPSKEPIK